MEMYTPCVSMPDSLDDNTVCEGAKKLIKYTKEQVYMSQAQKLGYKIDEMVHVWLLEMAGWGHQGMHRWVGMTLLHMHKVFLARRGRQMILMSLGDITVMVFMYRVQVI